jgi:hypothetical protein
MTIDDLVFIARLGAGVQFRIKNGVVTDDIG